VGAGVGPRRNDADFGEIDLGQLGDVAAPTSPAFRDDEANRPRERAVLDELIGALAKFGREIESAGRFESLLGLELNAVGDALGIE